jgi:hypothetical protein
MNTHPINDSPASRTTPPTSLTATGRSREDGNLRRVERRKETTKSARMNDAMMGTATSAALSTGVSDVVVRSWCLMRPTT